MPKDYRKQLTFQSGEISPRFYGRSDTPIYAHGLQIAENVQIDKRGGAFKRHGTFHQGRTEGDNARVFNMQVSRQKFYTIVIKEGLMIIIAPGAKFLGDNLLLNPSFNLGAASWDVDIEPATSRVVFSSGEAILIPEINNPQLIEEPNFSQGGIAWTVRLSHVLSQVVFENNTCTLLPRQLAAEFAGIAQAMDTTNPAGEHFLKMTGIFGNNQVRVQIGNAEGDGSIFDDTVGTNDDTIEVPFIPGIGTFWVTIDCEFPSVFVSFSSVTVHQVIEKTAAIRQEATVTAAITDLHVAVVGQLANDQIRVLIGTTPGGSEIAETVSTSIETQVEFVPNNATFWVTVLADGDVTDRADITFVGTAPQVDSGAIGLEMDAPWTVAQLDEIHIAAAPEGETLYFLHPNVPPQQLIYDFATDVFVPLAACVFEMPPEVWQDTNWPSTGTHFQGRLWLGGAPFRGRQTVWGSVSGSPLDFTKGAGEDAGSLEFILQEQGKIEWMLGTKNLLIGAENGEHIINSDGPVITDTDFKIEQQSSFGSNNMQGSQVGEKVFYVTPDGRQLRAMAYQWQENNWLSQDLTFMSEHITEIGIKHSAWAQHPDSFFVCVLKDGTIANMTYDRSSEIIAWTHLTIPGFFVYDVSTARRQGRSELTLVGRRVSGQIDVESEAGDTQYLDSYASEFHPLGGNVVTGLDHLEGEQVRILVDGAVDPLQTVIGGQVTSQISGQQLHAGVGYGCKIKTLPVDEEGASIRSWKKRWNKVWALLLASNPPIINGVRPPDRTPSTPMNTPEPVRTGHHKTVNLGWDDHGQITIEEDLPVPMNVLAIYGEMGAETL